MKMTKPRILHSCLSVAIFLSAAAPISAQSFGLQRDAARMSLGTIKKGLKENYYDPNFHGVDLDSRFKQADAKLKEATTTGQLWGIIAQAILDLDDSHTSFLPPELPTRYDYGWQMSMTGDKCFVSAVRPDSDAEKKGLKTGDEVWTIDGFGPTRENLWKLKYYYYSLRPREHMTLVVRKPDGQEQELDIKAKVVEGSRLNLGVWDMWNDIRESENIARFYRQRFHELNSEVLIWKMPSFEMSHEQVANAMDRVKKYKSLILDLRGNPGGYADNVEWLVGYFFDHDIKIAELKGRKQIKPLIGKNHGNGTYQGQILVLVDSESASAAELFARVMQLEKRGKIIGDRTAGAVMLGQYFSYGTYGLSITIADLIMSDGKSLEHQGVLPDEVVLPSARDMAAGRDPALAYAANLLKFNLSPEKAASLFPIEWLK